MKFFVCSAFFLVLMVALVSCQDSQGDRDFSDNNSGRGNLSPGGGKNGRFSPQENEDSGSFGFRSGDNEGRGPNFGGMMMSTPSFGDIPSGPPSSGDMPSTPDGFPGGFRNSFFGGDLPRGNKK